MAEKLAILVNQNQSLTHLFLLSNPSVHILMTIEKLLRSLGNVLIIKKNNLKKIQYIHCMRSQNTVIKEDRNMIFKSTWFETIQKRRNRLIPLINS